MKALQQRNNPTKSILHMCGIVGYIGDKRAEDVLITALTRLEYRGYDSAGIAAVDAGHLTFLKQSGKLAALRELLQKSPL